MATELKDKRLYCVRTSECCYHSGIEASDAKDAIRVATEHMQDKSVYDVKCEKIYVASIGVEAQPADESISSNAVYDIEIRGTDPKVVDALKHALGCLICGPHQCDETEFDEKNIGSTKPLTDVIEEYEIGVTAY